MKVGGYVVICAALAAISCGSIEDGRVGERRAALKTVPHGADCASLGYSGYELVVSPAADGVYAMVGGNVVTVTLSPDGIYAFWSATTGVDAVIVRSASTAGVYEWFGGTSGDWFVAPSSPDQEHLPQLQELLFCYDVPPPPSLHLKATVTTSKDKTLGWTISKRAGVASLSLSEGQTASVAYEVAVEATSQTSSAFRAEGSIVVQNSATVAATLASVGATADGGFAASVSCPGVTFPHALAAGASLSCSFGVDLPDATTRTLTVTAGTSGDVEGVTTTASIDFGSAVVSTRDTCIAVDDDKYGYFGVVCGALGTKKVFRYALTIGPFACGQSCYHNTASFEAKDSGAAGSATASVAIDVSCDPGCTLTPGYWKTHSSYGPASKADPTWLQLSQGPDTTFYKSGKSYYEVLWTSPKGNAYYILAHAFIAAMLNKLAGADTSAVAGDYQKALSLFQSYSPADVASDKKLKPKFIGPASSLDDYNNGIIGPGHCQ